MHECIEQGLLLRILFGGVLWVPLHSDDPFGSRPFDGFDDSIVAAAGDNETLPQGINGLMVKRETGLWSH